MEPGKHVESAGLGLLGTFWCVLGPSGAFWGFLGPSGPSWDLLGLLEAFYRNPNAYQRWVPDEVWKGATRPRMMGWVPADGRQREGM